MSNNSPTRAHFEELDRNDVLARHRGAFDLPPQLIYLDGNSLGPVIKGVHKRVSETVTRDWAMGLISSWNKAGWFDLPALVGNKIAKLIGAGPGEVMVGDSTSLNIFKLATAILRKSVKRQKILVEKGNFPTDIYILQGIVRLFEPRFRLVLAEHDDIANLIDSDTALILLTQVNYRSGRRFDMAAITSKANSVEAPIIWDLCHSTGAFPVDLNGCGVEYAVGCSYKYLNGGPGAPAYTYIASSQISAFEPVVTGWHSHARQFSFEEGYEAENSNKKMLVGTPNMLSLVALDEALNVWADVDLNAVRAKSLALTNAFIDLVERNCGADGLKLATPRSEMDRGSQVSWASPNGYAIMQALIARGVIGDFRAPDLMRFGFQPLYLRFVDVFDSVIQLSEVLASGEWRRPEFSVRHAVT